MDTNRNPVLWEKRTTGDTPDTPSGPFQQLTEAPLPMTLSVWENEQHQLTRMLTIKNFCLETQGLFFLWGSNSCIFQQTEKEDVPLSIWPRDQYPSLMLLIALLFEPYIFNLLYQICLLLNGH